MISRARLALLRSLKRRSSRETEGLYLLEGKVLILTALRSGAPVDQILLSAEAAESPGGAAVLDAARERGVEVAAVPARDLAKLADTKTPQGVVAVVARPAPDSAAVSGAALSGAGVVLALDGVADPGNVGTLVRAADAFAVRAVVAGAGTADFTNPKVLRAAMGSTFHLELLTVPDLGALLRAQRERGAEVVAATMDGENAHALPPAPAGRVLVLGNEARGISAEVLDLADRKATVPCPGRAESLNVAMAGSILLALFTKGAP